jgi:hypothetical protein
MPVQPEIEDGPPPGYMNPNIQVVSVDNTDMEIQPEINKPCLVRAVVRNTGDVEVRGAVVNLYWSNPLLGMDRSTATFLGSANIGLAPGETGTALCLVP